MNIIVTGGAGFIGSHVVDRLIEMGHRVLAVDDLSTGSPRNVSSKATLEVLPVESCRLSEVVGAFRPEAVVHCAAQTSVASSWKDAGRDAAVNIGGSINVVQASVDHGVRKLVYCSSAAVYGDPLRVPLDEDHPVNPISPYGISKLAVEQYLKAYQLQHGLEFAALRFANVYGPRQRTDLEGGVVAIFVEQIGSGREPTVYGDGTQTRDFVYVEDVAGAVVRAIQTPGTIIGNVSSGTGVSINGLTELLAKVANRDLRPRFGPTRPGDITRSCLDNSLIGRSLGWQPAVSLEEGLRRTWRAGESDRMKTGHNTNQ